MRQPLLATALLAVVACGREELVHGVDEAQANQILVALEESGVAAEKHRDEASEGAWKVEVAGADAAPARRVLSERELPRARPPGFGEVFGKGSVVPTPTEERALYLHALGGELARSVEAVDGVTEARVHLALAAPDPLRADPAPASRGAVLVKTRPGARERVEALAPGLRELVAGAVPGLPAAAVSVIVTEAAAPAPRPRGRGDHQTALLASAAVAAALAAALLAAPALRRLALRRLGAPPEPA